MVEIHRVEDLLRLVAEGGTLVDVAIQGLNLANQGELLRQIAVDGALFLGCVLPDGLLSQLTERGAIVFPKLTGMPFEPFRSHLYSSSELFNGFDPSTPASYCHTPDGRIYQHYLDTGKATPATIRESLYRRLHDHSVTDAMHDFLEQSPQAAKGVIAMMGGHSLKRSNADYWKVAVASRELTEAGYLMVSGGGPGAMEATHLGAWLAGRDDQQLDEAIRMLSDFGDSTSADTPDYRQENWLASAFDVMEAFPRGDARHTSLGIPTWLYGHEPPTPLATHIAKYFANSVREDGLVTIAISGIVFAPGGFGTFQEVFQDATQNHYATTPAKVSPMVFLGREFWTSQKPVFPLLQKLAEDSQLCDYLTLVDDVPELIDFIVRRPARTGAYEKWSFCEAFGRQSEHGFSKR